MLCDSHTHFIPKDISEYSSFYKGIWSDKNIFFEFLEANEIERAILVYPSTEAHLKLGWKKVSEIYNSAVENLVKENKKIIGFGIVDLDSDLKTQVKRLKESGFKGINIASSQDGKFVLDKLKPLFEIIQEYNMAVFVHPQTINPIGFERVKDALLMPVLEYTFDISMFLGLLMMEGILDEFNINFIFSSLAGVIPFLADRFDRVYTMLRNRNLVKDLGCLPSKILKKVYVDTSGATLQNIKLAIDFFGEDKILWGSDYPVAVNVKENLSMLDKLGNKVKEKIISKNFINLFGI